MTAPGAVCEVAEQPKILIVEDEGLIARDIERILEQLGYGVSGVVSSGTDALEMASLVASDLVLMDVRIRGDLDGIQTAELLRQRHGVPVVYLTAHADDSTVERAKATEPYGYIVKPFTKADIKVSVEFAIQRHRLQQKLAENEAWLTTVLRSMGDALIVSDSDGRVCFLNQAAEVLTGWCSAEAVGRDLGDVVHWKGSGQGSEEQNASLDATQAEFPQLQQGELLRRDNSRRVVIGTAAPLRGEAGSGAAGVVIVLRELPDLEKTERG